MQLDEYSRGIAELMQHQHDNRFPDLLMDTLRQWVPFDNGTVLLCLQGKAPIVAYNDRAASSKPGGYSSLLAGGLSARPFLPGGYSQHWKPGLYSLKELIAGRF